MVVGFVGSVSTRHALCHWAIGCLRQCANVVRVVVVCILSAVCKRVVDCAIGPNSVSARNTSCHCAIVSLCQCANVVRVVVCIVCIVPVLFYCATARLCRCVSVLMSSAWLLAASCKLP